MFLGLYDLKESFTNTHQNTELKQIDGVAHAKGKTYSRKAWKNIRIDTVLPNKEVGSDHVPLISRLGWSSMAQIKAQSYRNAALFFNYYWNWNRVKSGEESLL